MNRPTIQRAPRLIPPMPGGSYEIPPPPPPPSRPSLSLWAALIPVGMGLLSTLLMVLAFRSRGGIGYSLLYSAPMMLLSGALPLYQFHAQRAGYRRALQEREARYRAALERCSLELDAQREAQRAALAQPHPDPGECVERAVRRDSRLWERSGADADFLSLRLGIGSQPFAVSVKPPRADPVGEPDPLMEAAHRLASRFAEVEGVPVCLDLAQCGVAGLVGSGARELARALVMQLAVAHAPDEVKMAALLGSEDLPAWSWLRWLPHTWSEDGRERFLAFGEEAAARLALRLEAVLLRRLRREGGPAAPAAGERRLPLPCYVLLVDQSLLGSHRALGPILRAGTEAGLCALVLAPHREALPQGCRAIVESEGESGRLIPLAPGKPPCRFRPDRVSPEEAERLSRALAPLRPQGGGQSPPDAVPLLALLGVRRVEELDLGRRWGMAAAGGRRVHGSEPAPGLEPAPIGLRAGGEPVLLDLHERGDGPHGLVAGATGSGKSELLLSLLATLAACHHPHELSFVIVDYKGGGMAQHLAGLPHLIGTITNLQGNLASRALVALRGEIHRRQGLLSAAGVSHVDEYQAIRRERGLEPLPHLVLVVDEFAELKADRPEFMRELISAVRVGRSLGLHLILATQKPAGVVDEQIWGNARFRICLRVERPEDSQEVLKRPDAASLTHPGRAYLQVGSGERFELFQAGWGGAPYQPDEESRPVIAAVDLDGTRQPFKLAWRHTAAASGVASSPTPPSHLQALVRHLAAEAERLGIRPLPGPWLPPLPEALPLEQLRPPEGWDGRTWAPPSAWMEPVIGLVDAPAAQRQEPLRLPLGREGHLAVYGAPGTGKTTFLLTLVTSLGLSHSPADLHIYLLDCGGRALATAAGFPHVGGLVLADEPERATRLFRLLQGELEDRKDRFGRAGVTTLAAYRRATGEPVPAVLLVLDNYAGFLTAYPDLEEALALLAREGGGLGIHLVLTAAGPSAVRARVSSNLTLAVALQLADRTEYSMAVGRGGGEPAPLPGRGLVKGAPPLEFQTALPAAGEGEAERSAAIRALAAAMDAAWSGPRPRPVPALPERIDLTDLLELAVHGETRQAPARQTAAGQTAAGQTAARQAAVGPAIAGLPRRGAPAGLEVESLKPLWVDLADGPHFLIAGPYQSGKSTFLQSWLLALASLLPPEQLWLYLADFQGDSLLSLRALPHVRALVTESEELSQVVSELGEELRLRREQAAEARRQGAPRPPTASPPALVLAIDDYAGLRDGVPSIKEAVEQFVRRDRGLGFHLLLAGTTADLLAGWDGVAKAMREQQTGFLLGSSDHGELQLAGIRLPPGEAGRPLPPGVGYFVRRGRYRKFKGAVPGEQVPEWASRAETIRPEVEGGVMYEHD
jgi:S-DNA-T family DNA segregation ATPase FtsK/SpoIIIE